MKLLIQRVSEAAVRVDGEIVGSIQQGLLALVGIEKQDDESTLQRMAHKLLHYRVFADEAGKMNLNVQQVRGGVLAISQFTLAADTDKGLRPSFSRAAPPDQAAPLFTRFLDLLNSQHQPVASGIFAADMKVNLVNDGPVTFLLEG